MEIRDSVLLFGRMRKHKGLDYLLRASEIVAREIPNFKIILAGDGSSLETYQDVIDQNEHCVIHEGFLTDDRVTEVFQQCSVVVLPYIEGSQSGVVRVAYVFGKPAIVTDVGSIQESVEHGCPVSLFLPVMNTRW